MKDPVLHIFRSTTLPPKQFTFPFCYSPHPLVLEASSHLQEELSAHKEWDEEISRGKMFGVLVVEIEPISAHIEEENNAPDGKTKNIHTYAFLAAFSGTLSGQTLHSYFVEPVFDLMKPGSHFVKEEAEISAMVKRGENTQERSIALQRWLFSQYNFQNALGSEAGIDKLFEGTLPPSGTGDCCAPKLLQAAYKRHLKPLCMGEFWMGESPKNEIRQSGHFYPACSGKCKPLLRHMLIGLDVEENPLLRTINAPLEIIYQDDSIVVVNKPSGMLAVPGKDALPNVQEHIQKEFPQAEGPLIVHRLDMDTSGIMVLALTYEAYHHLQEQFVTHKVSKRYTALLERPLAIGQEGRIDLPLCPDITDRPRQMVHEKYGRRSITQYQVVAVEEGHTVIHLWPHTGRTHQLRVHMAHPLGLGNPIVGDRLYGTQGERLCLHAEELTFIHPTTGKEMHFVAPKDF